ncbi:Hypothetical protein I5071_10850 [Sandaracinus amylolyticus]|nr:Hypothetical protein I5071_10850 [Sandaracinus amylolyticus]
MLLGLRGDRPGARDPRALTPVLVALFAIASASCGARSTLDIRQWEAGAGPVPSPERCNGIDDDLDGLVASGVLDGGVMDGGVCGRDGGCDLDQRVDEDFRDDLGRYVHPEHCGACGRACTVENVERSVEVTCGIVEESPVCVALACEPGFAPSSTGRCVPIWDRLCLPCADDGDCGDLAMGASCSFLAGERRCTIDCALGCPDGYACLEGVCAPEGGSCSCEPGDDFDLACALIDPEGLRCAGSATCDDGALSECVAPDEVCDEVDNDCDGTIDEGYRDARGAYILDIHHCGECGVDCTLSTVPEGDLVCGGDPFVPTCVLSCPDAEDGIQPGDEIDGDRDIATGCECTVTALSDVPGPVRASGEMLDVNCDGADGIVVQSFYVAADGNDAWPGSPTRPLRHIDVALERAAMSLETGSPRPHVFVAVGLYTETLHVPDGVQLHGGYRRDFLSLDPDGFRVEVRAPSDTTAPGGAAMEVRGAGERETVIEWISLRGVDADGPSEAAFGAYLLDPGPRFVMRDMTVRAGVPGSGVAGANGVAGVGGMSMPEVGEVPRGAIEDGAHRCLSGDARNVVRGGRGGRNVCDGVETHGGDGGSPRCPMMSTFQPAGVVGRSAGTAPGGAGGNGGQDSRGPITRETGTCPTAVCCGLADFSVPTDFTGPQPGRPGNDGVNGAAGRSCAEAFGRFEDDRWVGVDATLGTVGRPGSGGGGGGAGGGAEMQWFDRSCEFVDGLGGGGGGGGAGGCGGQPGRAGTSGAPSVAILVRYTAGAPTTVPTISGVTIAPSDGGRGGDGGAGGDGGQGANGAFGGALDRATRTTPTLAGPFAGARGGQGGNGGAGGGGGAGCGGASVGVWITGVSSEPAGVGAWRSGNTFELGRGGLAGRGGGGAAAAMDGAAGGSSDVVVR